MKNYIIGGIVGGCIVIAVFCVWTLLNMQSRVSKLESFASEVAKLINSSSKPTSTK